jgi:hypothetical protein
VSVNLVLYGLVGPFAAAVMQSLGIRRTVMASLALVATGVALTTIMGAPGQLVLLRGVLVGLGTGTTAIVLGATIVQRWFVARRGLVIGILTAATATGQLIFLPVLASLVARSGWRAVSITVAAVVLLVIPIVFFAVRDRPADVGALPYGASPDDPPPAAPRGNPLANAVGALRRASRQRDFWLLAGFAPWNPEVMRPIRRYSSSAQRYTSSWCRSFLRRPCHALTQPEAGRHRGRDQECARERRPVGRGAARAPRHHQPGDDDAEVDERQVRRGQRGQKQRVARRLERGEPGHGPEQDQECSQGDSPLVGAHRCILAAHGAHVLQPPKTPKAPKSFRHLSAPM